MKDKKKFYINGQWVNPIKAKDFNVINPSTEEVCAIISLGSSEDTRDQKISRYFRIYVTLYRP